MQDPIRRDIERIVGFNPRDPRDPSFEIFIPRVPPEFNGPEMTALLTRKRDEWLRLGIRPRLVQMALDQAVNGAQGVVRRMARFATNIDRRAVMIDFIENVSDQWVRTMSNGGDR
jgi:hypothetical protein